MTEVWKPVIGFEDCYEVSNTGLVRSIDRCIEKSNGELLNRKGVLIKLQKNAFDYYTVTLTRDSKKSTKLVHSLVLTSFTCARPEKMECRHMDGNKHNNNIENLAWGTRLENARDKARHGTQNRGETMWTHVLTEKQVLEMRSKFIPGKTALVDLAKEYNVDAAAIGDAVSGRSWAHLPGANNDTKYFGRRGNDSGAAKLTDAKVIWARTQYATGKFRCNELAKQLGVYPDTLAKALTGRNWGHVKATIDAPLAVMEKPQGSKHWCSKLTEDIVRKMREDYRNGSTKKEIATKFSVPYSTVSGIISRQRWKDLV